MSIKKKLGKLLKSNNKPLEETLYDVLSEKDYSKGSYEKQNLGEDMWLVNNLVLGWWKPKYLIDDRNHKAYEIMDDYLCFVHFSSDDIDWESLKSLPEEALERARNLDAQFPTFVRGFHNGIAKVYWQLNPDGRYYMDEDGFGMTSDVEIEVSGTINREMKVLEKFHYTSD